MAISVQKPSRASVRLKDNVAAVAWVAVVVSVVAEIQVASAAVRAVVVAIAAAAMEAETAAAVVAENADTEVFCAPFDLTPE